MIIIKNINNEPDRSLTPEELLTVTSILSNGVDFIYYQGDEPVIEEIIPEETEFDSTLRVSRVASEPVSESTVIIENEKYTLVENKLSWWQRFLRIFK